MNTDFPEIESVLDDWVLLKKSTLRTRKLPDSILLKFYSPPHSTPDSLTPLQWRKRILSEKHSGFIIDTDMKNGAAMLGITSCKNISYIGIVHNYRHRDAFQRLIRVLGLRAEIYASLDDIPDKIRKSAIYIR